MRKSSDRIDNGHFYKQTAECGYPIPSWASSKQEIERCATEGFTGCSAAGRPGDASSDCARTGEEMRSPRGAESSPGERTGRAESNFMHGSRSVAGEKDTPRVYGERSSNKGPTAYSENLAAETRARIRDIRASYRSRLRA